MRYLCFIPFALTIILSGCNDTEGILELKGSVLDEYTKVPVPDRRIIVQSIVKQDNKDIATYAGEFSTDSSGNFEYALKKAKNVWLYNFSVVSDSQYGFSNKKLGLTELAKYGKFLTFYLGKLADFTIKIERISKFPFNDTLYVSWESNGIDGEILYPCKIDNYGNTSNIGFRWIGVDTRSEIKTKVFAGKKTTVNWSLFRAGFLKEMTDTIICNREGTNNLYFKY
jgi:hypothetical protein